MNEGGVERKTGGKDMEEGWGGENGEKKRGGGGRKKRKEKPGKGQKEEKEKTEDFKSRRSRYAS